MGLEAVGDGDDTPNAYDPNSEEFLTMYIKKIINSTDVIMFSKEECPFCISSKQLLDQLNIKYMSLELDQLDEGPMIQRILGKMTGQHTVPRIFVKGKCIGGSERLQVYHDTGKLQKMLSAKKWFGDEPRGIGQHQ